jgi:RNA recognition motif-containing protein
MSPAFGFSVGDFIAAIELCTKVAKALKEASTAAAEYQQVVLELQGLQNVLTRLAALEPTGSNIQYVNAIRGAALASTLPLQEFLSKLEKFDKSMSPFAAKTKTLSLSKAGRQTQYALFMADEVKKLRAVVYGNVIRINVMLASHASETASRTESQLATGQRELIDRFNDTRDDMANIINEIAGLKAEVNASREEVAQKAATSTAQMQERLRKADADTASLTQSFSNLSVGISSISNSVSSIRSLSSQILSLLRVIPAELGNLVQNVICSNARTESALFRIEQNIAASPSLKNETNIRMEDALGRPHDLPYEWFRYWETFEGLLKAKFKDVPGNQKIDSGDFRLVHRKRPTIALDKDSWSAAVGPGADLVMLMLITDVVFGESSCPRKSCSGRVSSDGKGAGFLTCPECGLQFISQVTPTESFEADEITELQRLEDEKLFGMREQVKLGLEGLPAPLRITDVTQDVQITDNGDDANTEVLSIATSRNDSQSRTMHDHRDTDEHGDGRSIMSDPPQPPIYSWLAQTVPPEDPDTVLEWREAEETHQQELNEREAKDLEVFRNVQIVIPSETAKPAPGSPTALSLEESKLETGARVFYRNILDQYPFIDRSFARRLAKGNWERQKLLTSKQYDMERAKSGIRPPAFQNSPPEMQDVITKDDATKKNEAGSGKADEWEDFDDNIEPPCRLPATAKEGVTPKNTPPSDPASRQAPWSAIAYGTASLLPQMDSHQNLSMRERRLCTLPPLPIALPANSTTGSLMVCYLCHSEVRIQTKRQWRIHVMEDLQPYMCPVADCSFGDTMHSSRRSLLGHLTQHHNADESAKCPFCGITELPEQMKVGNRTFIKHIGHHMEEAAFAVVSTAYENWSYDESASEPEMPATDLQSSQRSINHVGRLTLPHSWLKKLPQQWSVFDEALPNSVLGPCPLQESSNQEPDSEIIPNAIVIKNIPFSADKEELLALMVDLALPLPYAFNYHFENGNFSGVAFANFMIEEWAALAISVLNNFGFGGRKLKVEYKKKTPSTERDTLERDKREDDWFKEQHRPPAKETRIEEELLDQYQQNFWTGNMTSTSPASSANSPLRDPWPANYLTAGFADQANDLWVSRPSSPVRGPGLGFSALDSENPGMARSQETKRRRRRQSHHIVERRRRDNINERIKDLSDLVPRHRLEDEKVRKHITKGLSMEDKAKEPNKLEILTGAVGWTRDMMWLLSKKIQDTDKMEARLRELTGKQWRRRTADEQRMRTELFDAVQKNGAAEFKYSRGPGSGLGVPKHTDIAGRPLKAI